MSTSKMLIYLSFSWLAGLLNYTNRRLFLRRAHLATFRALFRGGIITIMVTSVTVTITRRLLPDGLVTRGLRVIQCHSIRNRFWPIGRSKNSLRVAQRV